MLTQSLSVWESSYDVATNTSVVSIVLTSTQDQYSYQGYTQTGTYWLAANGGGWDGGTNYTYTLQKSTTNTILSTTRTVTHNADGTGSVKVQTSSPTTPSVGTVVKEVSINLTTIPRASTPTVSKSSADMNTAITINTNRASSSFTHTLTYKFGNATGTIGTAKGVGASINWTIPISFANQVPSATSGTCTITCQTYSGNTLVGTKTVNLTCTVPSSVVPTISSVTPSDPTGYLSTYGAYVQSKSKVKVAVSASGAYSSTIKSVSINNGVGGTSTSNPYESGVITAGAGSKTVSVTVTDTRGRTATKTATFTVVGYAVPNITAFANSRCNQDGSANDAGAYMKITYAASITNINNKNANGHTFTVRYKKKSESSYTNAVNVTNAYSVNSSVVVAADTESTYDIQFLATDSFSTTSRTNSLSSAFVLMDFNKSGKGVAFGKVSESDKFEVGMEFVGKKVTTEAGADLDTLNANMKDAYLKIASNNDVTSSKSYAVNLVAYTHVLVIIGNYQNANMFFVRRESASTAFIFKFSSGGATTTFSCSYSNNVLTIKSNSSASAYCSVMKI